MPWQKGEAEGYECAVISGIKKSSSDEQEWLSKLAPQTDLANVIIFESYTATSSAHEELLIGGAGLLLGLLCLSIVCVHAWRIYSTKS
jgi:hypothetical protein